ncbi:ABC transporter substrate-binding protein [Bifidobacterium oedipodis]|nr:ABC transporter substrate-binding protein [Bifidobacterium sp. DSM 109957]
MAIVSILGLLLPLSACGSSAAADNGLLYVFNTKSEIKDGLEKLVNEYGKEHGIEVKVFSPGSGSDTVETMNTEMTSSTPPAIFSTNSLVTWGPADGDFMLDLNESDNADLKALAQNVPDELRFTSEGDENLGLPYTLEGYGYLVDVDVLKDLFALDDDKVAELIADLKACDFDTFRAFTDAVDAYINNPQAISVNVNGHEYTTAPAKTGLANDLTGVFVESGAEKWTYADHMVNIPLNAVFENYGDAYSADLDAVDALKKPLIKEMEVLDYNTSHAAGEDGPNTRGPSFVNSTTGSYDYALQLFAEHKGLFFKQGNWIYPNLKAALADTEDAGARMLSSLEILPIKMPFEQSDISVKGRTPETFNTYIPAMVPNYWIINKKSSAAQQKNAADFLVWLFTSDRGRSFLTDECGFILYDELDQPDGANSLNNALLHYASAGKTLSNPFNASPGNWLEFVGNQLKQNYMTKAKWDESTYPALADTVIARWKNLKDIQSS